MTDNDLNEQVNVTVDDASVITVPIDATLQNSNEAADAKAVGDALALKADADAVVAIKVNGQAADAQGLILIDGSDIPVSGTDQTKISAVLENITAKTAENIPMSSDAGAKTIAEVVNENTEAIENMQDKTGANIPMDTGSSTTIKVAIESLDQRTVKTINKKGPDADGDVDMSVVPLAENLQSDKMQSIEGAFIQRTSGGNGSVSDGKAYPLHIFGHMERQGYVAEELNMTVIPMPRTEPDEPITAEIDRDTFVAYVDESGTIDLYYTTEWSADPELYGVTVTGTPVAGDQIKIVYVKEKRGTILVADPERLVATGWNLFNINKGYAKVVRYSSEYGYKIGGGYSSLTFSPTLTGERASITPNANGLFNISSDGYVFVNGGNGTDTYILATWSDWVDGPSTGYWEPYKESGIALGSVIDTYLPDGMLAIGTVMDEIDFSAKRAISRIERMTYSEENLAAAIATGRAYIYDTDYIYLVRAEAVISAITIDSEYTASEHGLEYFTETVMPLGTEILYGKNLRDKLERDVLTISAQTLTAEEKAQVRKNIGAMNPPGNNGTEGQLLKTNGDGSTSWTNQGTPSDAQVGTAVTAWLNAHPEATTTVEDGAISRAKLDADLKGKTDKVAVLESAINAEKTARESSDEQIREQIILEAGYRRNDIEELREETVPFPEDPDSKFGTNGQVLRTKGNGKTEWVDVGQPTDEQTAEAVEAWLDAHPEATTTVEDGTISEEKLTENLQTVLENIRNQTEYAKEFPLAFKREIRCQRIGALYGMPVQAVFEYNNYLYVFGEKVRYENIYLFIVDKQTFVAQSETDLGITGHPNSAWMDGSYYYVVDSDGSKLYKFAISDNSLEETITPSSGSITAGSKDAITGKTYLNGVLNGHQEIYKLENDTITAHIELGEYYGSTTSVNNIKQSCFAYNNVMAIVYNYPNTMVLFNIEDGAYLGNVDFGEGDGFYPYGEIENFFIVDNEIHFASLLYDGLSIAGQIFRTSISEKGFVGNGRDGQAITTRNTMYADNTGTRTKNPDGSSTKPFFSLVEAAAVFKYNCKLYTSWFTEISVNGTFTDGLAIENADITINSAATIGYGYFSSCNVYLKNMVFGDLSLRNTQAVIMHVSVSNTLAVGRSKVNVLDCVANTFTANHSIIDGIIRATTISIGNQTKMLNYSNARATISPRVGQDPVSFDLNAIEQYIITKTSDLNGNGILIDISGRWKTSSTLTEYMQMYISVYLTWNDTNHVDTGTEYTRHAIVPVLYNGVIYQFVFSVKITKTKIYLSQTKCINTETGEAVTNMQPSFDRIEYRQIMDGARS